MDVLLQEIHDHAVKCAKDFIQCETALLQGLEKVDTHKVHLALGYSSLFDYCTKELKLSESHTCALTSVMRKAKEIPALKSALSEGVLSVSRGKRILSVLTSENAAEWIEKARTLTQRELEKEVVGINPTASLPDRVRPMTSDLSHFSCGIRNEVESKLRRVQDLLSQKSSKACSWDETLEAMASLYLERNDPTQKKLKKPQASKTTSRSRTRYIPRFIKNRVLIRDKGQCTAVVGNGQRCGSRRWVQIHHIDPYAKGGEHSISNLTTLCYGHHKAHHFKEEKKLNDINIP